MTPRLSQINSSLIISVVFYFLSSILALGWQNPFSRREDQTANEIACARVSSVDFLLKRASVIQQVAHDLFATLLSAHPSASKHSGPGRTHHGTGLASHSG